VDTTFTAQHRGGAGSPMVLLHGFSDTWRTWELVLPSLERRHDVLAPTLLGHAGGPPVGEEPNIERIAEAIERSMDEAGFETAHLVGNSLGGYVALRIAARGRARSVTALAPAGGWPKGDESWKETLGYFTALQDQLRPLAPQAERFMATPEGRRRATLVTTVRYEHIPAALLAHMMRGVAECDAIRPMVDRALAEGYSLDAEKVTCPVRIVWGTADALLPWPRAAERYRTDWLPHADWVELEDVGHCPQLDVPLETAELILGFASG
jgi:pimeloyl-ACP methyl ester carboxylesterase